MVRSKMLSKIQSDSPFPQARGFIGLAYRIDEANTLLKINICVQVTVAQMTNFVETMPYSILLTQVIPSVAYAKSQMAYMKRMQILG